MADVSSLNSHLGQYEVDETHAVRDVGASKLTSVEEFVSTAAHMKAFTSKLRGWR